MYILFLRNVFRLRVTASKSVNNYSFLGLPDTGDDFPHENKGSNTEEFMKNLFVNTKSAYDEKVESELAAWWRKNGYELKKITREF